SATGRRAGPLPGESPPTLSAASSGGARGGLRGRAGARRGAAVPATRWPTATGGAATPRGARRSRRGAPDVSRRAGPSLDRADGVLSLGRESFDVGGAIGVLHPRVARPT